MMFKTRTEPVPYGLEPYKWDIDSVYQCVWYVFYRCLECGFSPIEWWNRETKEGSYYHAKTWLKNYRDPWQVKGTDYVPVAGDVAVYDYGEYGHVVFLETDTMTSEYRNGDPNSFRNAKLGDFKGELLGYLHFPYETINPVERNANVDQIETTDDTLRIRSEPSLNGQIVGHVQLGFYNVLNASENDGYTWYEIAKDRWCANITVNFLPSSEDILKKIEEYFKNLKGEISTLTKENAELKKDIGDIKQITGKWV